MWSGDNKTFSGETKMVFMTFFRRVLKHLEVASQFWSNLVLDCPINMGSRDILCNLSKLSLAYTVNKILNLFSVLKHEQISIAGLFILTPN